MAISFDRGTYVYRGKSSEVIRLPEALVGACVVRAKYVGPSPVFRDQWCLLKSHDTCPTICMVQFDELIEFEGVNYGESWHPFAIEAFAIMD